MDWTSAKWRKSSYSSSSSSGGACVEVPAVWRKARYSGNDGGDCVEVARGAGPGAVTVRDSKDPDGPKLIFTLAQWTAFASAARAGHFRPRLTGERLPNWGVEPAVEEMRP